jgi:hypothetical protein
MCDPETVDDDDIRAMRGIKELILTLFDFAIERLEKPVTIEMVNHGW